MTMNEEEGQRGIHEKIKNTILHKSLYVPVMLPLPGYFVESQGRPQCLSDSENQ